MSTSKPLLRIAIGSFSYKKGLPVDLTPHGGGFVFDCRSIYNPGREAKFKDRTGRQTDVIDFLENREDAKLFWQHVRALILQAVSHHQSRGFDYLSIQFGCTGGQHRSVYFAEKTSALLASMDGVSVALLHRDMPV